MTKYKVRVTLEVTVEAKDRLDAETNAVNAFDDMCYERFDGDHNYRFVGEASVAEVTE